MRVISQDGTIDVPYDYFSLSVASGKYEDVEVAYIYCHNLSSPNGTKLAEYSTKEKAIKAMEMLREAYIGTPIVMQNVELTEDEMKAIERMNKCIMVRPIDEPSKVECFNNIIFQFPQDSDERLN